MFSEELKKLVINLGGILIVEDNQPKFVLLTYDKFKDLNSFENKNIIHKNLEIERKDILQSKRPQFSSEEQLIDKLNKEILSLKEEIKEKGISNL